jgi:ferredoxin-NADP reductase/nitrite reductase/ring-hydroxylating ferredoxin subunit
LPTRDDGFVFAADDAVVTEGAGIAVEVDGRELALFRIGGQLQALDAACPHEGALLVQGEVKDGVITCPWHGWTFNGCTGCSIEPAGHDLRRYETLVEEGKVFVRLDAPHTGAKAAPPARARPTRLQQPVEALLTVMEVIEETHDVRTFRFDNRGARIPCDFPGKFVKVCATIEGREVWRSFTISSSPSTSDSLDLTIKLNPGGEVSRHLFETIRSGSQLRLKGPQGGFFLDPERHTEPLALISAGSGITPMMSILRYLKHENLGRPGVFLHGARTRRDILFHDECRELSADLPGMSYHVALSQPDTDWQGLCGRLDFDCIRELVKDLSAHRYFLCGPSDFMDSLRASLLDAAVPAQQIHTEAFHSTAPAKVG